MKHTSAHAQLELLADVAQFKFSVRRAAKQRQEIYTKMATNTSLVALFDDIVASTNILTAGTEGSKCVYVKWLGVYSTGTCTCILCGRACIFKSLHLVLVCLSRSDVLKPALFVCQTVFAQFVSSQVGVNSQLHEMAKDNTRLKVTCHCM